MEKVTIGKMNVESNEKEGRCNSRNAYCVKAKHADVWTCADTSNSFLELKENLNWVNNQVVKMNYVEHKKIIIKGEDLDDFIPCIKHNEN